MTTTRPFVFCLLVVAATTMTLTDAFSVQLPRTVRSGASTSTTLSMGLFDGVKDAFSAPALERSVLDAERETPIDRWFGWSTATDSDNKQQQQDGATKDDFVDSMDGTNYVSVTLAKPMGIVFEENEEEYGGIFVQSLKDDSQAVGTLQQGDQLVAVSGTKVSGMPFDDALGAIVDDTSSQTTLLLFRGTASQLYGPTGASQEWLDEFIANSSSNSNSNNKEGQVEESTTSPS